MRGGHEMKPREGQCGGFSLYGGANLCLVSSAYTICISLGLMFTTVMVVSFYLSAFSTARYVE